MPYKYIDLLYEKVAQLEDLSCGPVKSDIRRRLFTKAKLRKILKPKAKLLEIGPGSGFITTGIIQELKEFNVKYSALDLSSSFLLKTHSKSLVKGKFYQGDICDLKFLIGEKFDFILLQEVLEHLPSPFQAMVNINKLLKQNGVLILTTPNTYKAYSQLELMYKKPRVYSNTHIAEFSPIGLLKLITMSGLEPIEVDFYNTRFKFLPNFIKQFFSSEICIVAQKVSTPRKQWEILTKTILDQQSISYGH